MLQSFSSADLDVSKLDPTTLATLPALQPPDGVVPNFDDPPSIAYQFRLVIYTTLSAMLLHVALRFYTRIRLKAFLGLDDCMFQGRHAI